MSAPAKPLGRGRAWAAGLLVTLGLMQSIGWILGVPAIRGLGTATAASPLPLVFSHFRGLETYSSDFRVEVVTDTGETVSEPLTPVAYSRLDGPYNRRNVYGAVAAYGIRLTEGNEPSLVRAVLEHGFCRGPLLGPLGLADRRVRSARLLVTNRFSKPPAEGMLEVTCAL
jgi:hypothetical protein